MVLFSRKSYPTVESKTHVVKPEKTEFFKYSKNLRNRLVTEV